MEEQIDLEDYIMQQEKEACLRMVQEFHTAFNMSGVDELLWLNLIEEEFQEVQDEEEGTEAYLKELCDLIYVHCGFLIATEGRDTWIRMLYDSALEGLLSFEEFNLEAFERVHESNMSKLDDEGKPIYNEAGKVMKGPNYKKPCLQDLV